MVNNKRESVIDMIKGTAIMAVVLLHIDFDAAENYFSLKSMLGGAWHVAVFFVISGWFLKDERLLNFKQFSIGKIKGLYLKAMWIYIPFVLLRNIFFKWNWLYDGIICNNRILHPFENITDVIIHIIMQFIFTHREPFSGAMWFVDSLFLGLLLYSIITITINSISKKYKVSIGGGRVCLCLVITIISMYLTKHNITIPKISNTCSALLLICVGNFLGKLKLRFDNSYLFVISLLIIIHYNALGFGMALNKNSYTDVVSLITAPVCVIYVLAYIYKRVENTFLGRVITNVGENSFWIMGLHMIGFHIFTSILDNCRFTFEHHFTTPYLGNNVILIIGYLLFGVFIPIFIKSIIVNCYIFLKNRI